MLQVYREVKINDKHSIQMPKEWMQRHQELQAEWRNYNWLDGVTFIGVNFSSIIKNSSQWIKEMFERNGWDWELGRSEK